MSKSTRHVVPDMKGGWIVKKSGTEFSRKIYPTQREAIQQGVSISKMERSELIIHRKDGSIRDVRSYAADPLPPSKK